MQFFIVVVVVFVTHDRKDDDDDDDPSKPQIKRVHHPRFDGEKHAKQIKTFGQNHLVRQF